MPFWKMIKQGYDHFEVTKQEPKVDVCEKHYVFNGQSADGKPLNFSPAGKCPVYQVPEEIAQAVQDKQRSDELQTAQLISRGSIAAAPVRTGSDGGMHPVFASKLGVNAGASSSGEYSLASYTAAPQRQYQSRRSRRSRPSSPSWRPPLRRPATCAHHKRHHARGRRSAGCLRLLRPYGQVHRHCGSDDKKPAVAPKTQTASIALPKARPAMAKTEPKLEQPKSVATTVATKPADVSAASRPATTASSNASPTITGSSPIVGANSFDSRWSAFR